MPKQPRYSIMPVPSKNFYGNVPVKKSGIGVGGGVGTPGNARPDMANNGFTAYAAGRRHYGTGRGAPNVGMTGNRIGYAVRDNMAAARKKALIRRSGGM